MLLANLTSNMLTSPDVVVGLFCGRWCILLLGIWRGLLNSWDWQSICSMKMAAARIESVSSPVKDVLCLWHASGRDSLISGSRRNEWFQLSFVGSPLGVALNSWVLIPSLLWGQSWDRQLSRLPLCWSPKHWSFYLSGISWEKKTMWS